MMNYKNQQQIFVVNWKIVGRSSQTSIRNFHIEKYENSSQH